MMVFRLAALVVILFLAVAAATACSMFKITHLGKTMVGNNEDAWRFDSKVWFEQGNDTLLGVMYVGHSHIPQGGMNEAGLAYDAFTVYKRPLKDMSHKPAMDGFGTFDRGVMQHCRTVDDVAAWISRYNTSALNGAMLLFVDSTGKYLIVEADTMMMGSDDKYVLANFCPSLTPDTDEVKIHRYKKGSYFLEGKQDTSLAFATAMMDTMHECRKRLGDGTTYTTIYDLKDKLAYVYYYHDYSKVVAFNLKEELAKPDHLLLMRNVFPPNEEYQRFVDHLTIRTSIPMFLLVAGLALILMIATAYWLWQGVTGNVSKVFTMVLIATNVALLAYLWRLTNDQAMFYFDAPYYIEGHYLLNAAAYLPFALLLITLGLLGMAVKHVLPSTFNRIKKTFFGLNITTYIALIVLFAYWGFFDVF